MFKFDVLQKEKHKIFKKSLHMFIFKIMFIIQKESIQWLMKQH